MEHSLGLDVLSSFGERNPRESEQGLVLGRLSSWTTFVKPKPKPKTLPAG
jgi:hypothetical protein